MHLRRNLHSYFPQKELNKFNAEALQRIRSGETVPAYTGKDDGIIPAAGTVLNYHENRPHRFLVPSNKGMTFINSDTLYVGDTLGIKGEWLRNGPIVIYNSGLLHFSGAQATILGDIYLLNEASLLADSSILYIPQAYFYQRAVVATGGSKVIYRNTTVDHSGLSHSILLVDSARLELINVINRGFTTNGIYHHSSVYVDGINQAGEYVIVDESSLEFHNAKTVLLWHQFPDNAEVDFVFPEGDSVNNYQFDESIAGVTGIGYSVLLDNCTDVMWGMMPATGSDITITGSEIRAIGLWFMGSDTVDVNGLVNNSYYDDFQAPLDDRKLRLIDCNVTTWSIYPMDQSVVNLSGCIVGEIGAGKRSTLMGSQFFCDGSGGYVWTSDTSFMLAGFSYTSGYVRSQANSILYYAYSSLSGGYLSALQNSVIMAIQCTLPEEPRAYDNGVAWYALIEGPSEAYAGETVQVTGSAWIDRTPTSELMDFGSYRLFYQESESTGWKEIPVDSLNEKRKEPLGIWNTAALTPGQYIIKLVIRDNWGNTAEAMKTISLQPSFAIEEPVKNTFSIYPNPANDRITILLPAGFENFQVSISDLIGRICLENEFSSNHEKAEAQIPLDPIPPGYYIVSVSSGKVLYQLKIMIGFP